MKVQNKISYSEDVDILMIQLSNNKIDDSYETDTSVVSVDKKGEPVLLEIFHASKLLKELGKSLSKEVKDKFLPEFNVAIPHQIRK